jgi:putative membrane protein insertion efficiency factor
MVTKFVIFWIRLYQYILSPLLPCQCRFLPTCSEYGVEACQKHGALKGMLLTLKRIARCHPWGGQGLDPVPESAQRLKKGETHD